MFKSVNSVKRRKFDKVVDGVSVWKCIESDSNGGFIVVRMKFFETTEREIIVKIKVCIKNKFQNFTDSIIFIIKNNVKREVDSGFRI